MPSDTPGTKAPPRRAAGRLVAIALGIAAFGVLLGLVLAQALRPRMGPGDVITGGAAPPQGAGADAAGDAGRAADLDALARRAEAAPADIGAQLELARAAADAGRTDLARPALDRVLERHPRHPGALTLLGLVTAAEGEADRAIALIERALAAAPGDPFALWAKGGLLFTHRRDYRGAAAAWEAMARSSRIDAATRATVREWIAEARWRAEHADGVPGPGDGARPAPGDTAGRDGGAAAGPEARPDGGSLSGTVRLAPGVADGSARQGALFIIARRGQGPPVAVKRIESPRFPLAYTLGPDDAMIPGRAMEGPIEVIARLSRSGSAGPARPGDLEGRFAGNPVTPGSSGVDIMLAPITPTEGGGAARGRKEATAFP